MSERLKKAMAESPEKLEANRMLVAAGFATAGEEWDKGADRHKEDGITAGELRDKADECFRIAHLLAPEYY